MLHKFLSVTLTFAPLYVIAVWLCLHPHALPTKVCCKLYGFAFSLRNLEVALAPSRCPFCWLSSPAAAPAPCWLLQRSLMFCGCVDAVDVVNVVDVVVGPNSRPDFKYSECAFRLLLGSWAVRRGSSFKWAWRSLRYIQLICGPFRLKIQTWYFLHSH